MTAAMILTVTILSTGSPEADRVRPWTGPSCEQGHALDKEFYNDYLDSLPNERVIRKRTLETNLLQIVRSVIPREDLQRGPEFVKSLKAEDLVFGRVTRDSGFVRGIMKEMPYLRETPYMWIVRAGPYLVFVTYKADPRRFRVPAHQTRTVRKRESPKTDGRDPAAKGAAGP